MNETNSSTKVTPKDTLVGCGKYLIFTIRHNLVRYLVWIGIVAFMVIYICPFYKSLFSDPKELQKFINTVGEPSMVAMVGTVSSLAVANAALSAAVWAKIWMFTALTLGIGMVFQVTKGVRADEENGRTELFRSRPFGIHSTLVAVISGAIMVCVVAGIITTALLAAFNMDPAGSGITGSLTFGLSFMAVGILGVGVGALSNQLSASGSIANSTGSIILMAFYCMRMIGDMGSNHTLTWLSPVGWAQKMAPYGENRIWLFVPNIILSAVLIMIALMIESRRDYGSGVLREKAGHPDAKPYMKRSWGLVLRLYKGSIIGWSIGVVLAGLMFGSVVTSMLDMLKGNDVPFLNASSIDFMMGFMLMFVGLISVVLPMFIMTGLRSDETKGLTEAQLAGSMSRHRMILERYVIATVATVFLLILGGASFGMSYGSAANDMSQIWKCVLDVLIYLPGIMAITSLVVLLFGWFPRATIPVTWFLYGLMYFGVLLIETLKLPRAVTYIIPFIGTPKLPAPILDDGSNGSVVAVVLYFIAAIVFVLLGMYGLRKRNIPR
jgi:Putative exporter of polyketide antibiotics